MKPKSYTATFHWLKRRWRKSAPKRWRTLNHAAVLIGELSYPLYKFRKQKRIERKQQCYLYKRKLDDVGNS